MDNDQETKTEEQQINWKSIWKWVVISFVLILMIGIFYINYDDSESQSSKNQDSNNKSEYTIEQQMAMIDAGAYIKKDDIKVKRFRYLLNTLHQSTGYEREKIADMVAQTRHIIRDKYGREVSLIHIMETACKSETVLSKTVKLEEFLAVYAAFAGQ